MAPCRQLAPKDRNYLWRHSSLFITLSRRHTERLTKRHKPAFHYWRTECWCVSPNQRKTILFNFSTSVWITADSMQEYYSRKEHSCVNISYVLTERYTHLLSGDADRNINFNKFIFRGLYWGSGRIAQSRQVFRCIKEMYLFGACSLFLNNRQIFSPWLSGKGKRHAQKEKECWLSPTTQQSPSCWTPYLEHF